MNTASRPIIVGVVPGQPDTVLTAAAEYAKHFHAPLVCASVDSARYPIDATADGSVVSVSLNSDIVDRTVEQFDPVTEAWISATLDPLGVAWSTRALAGSPAQELGRLAEQLDASMIVIGTRDPGLLSSLREFVNGSVGAQLAHRQHRPVVVIPLQPIAGGHPLPWEDLD